MKENFLTYLDTLLDAELSASISALPIYADTIEKKLAENRLLFDTKIDSLSNSDHNIHEAIAAKVQLLERDLQGTINPTDLTRVNTLNALAFTLFSFLKADQVPGLYLSEAAAQIILEKHPPTNLLTLEAELLASLTSLEKVSLTRHSESQTWQDDYLTLLRSLSSDSFEARPVRYTVVDSGVFAQVMNASDMRQKPWRMSHTKETGYINILTQTPDSIKRGVPSLQFILVLFHYYYETLYTGQFSLKNEKSGTVGKKLTEVITTGKDKFPFFHPNCYTEHLYWGQTLETFSMYAENKFDVSFFIDTLSCGEYRDKEQTDEPMSLNLIDQVWNLNIDQSGEQSSYFQFAGSSFLYHFREGLWYEILREICTLSPLQMKAFLKEHLCLGDKALTKALLDSHLPS